jgi:hypothetical protein
MNTAIIKPQWGPLTIALMVLGFVVWFPLGLAMLAYILWGEMFGGTADVKNRNRLCIGLILAASGPHPNCRDWELRTMHTAFIKPQWGPLSIALMVLGFVVWWPLGLAMLAYILWGEVFGGSAEKAEGWINRQKTWCRDHRSGYPRRWGAASSGNAAFDDYRAEQLRRLDEERKRLDEEVHAFHEHMRNLRMARDREEFDRFMRERGEDRAGRSGSDQPGA